MEAYVVVWYVPYEGGDVRGVFSTRAKAQAFIDKEAADNGGIPREELVIEAWEVDA